MMRYGGDEVNNHVILTSALDCGEHSASIFGHFNPRENALDSMMNLEACLLTVEGRKSLPLPGVACTVQGVSSHLNPYNLWLGLSSALDLSCQQQTYMQNKTELRIVEVLARYQTTKTNKAIMGPSTQQFRCY
jgi:hypothetical protein